LAIGVDDFLMSDEFDAIFFGKHGVGDVPIDSEFAVIAHQMNPNEPTLPELMFCRFLVKGDSQPDAYMKAFGYDGSEYVRDTFGRMAYRLLKRPRVSKALFEMKEKVNALMNEDLATLVSELNDDRKLARDLGQPSAAIAAVKAKANLLGLDQSTTQNMTINVSLTDDQKGQLLSRIARRSSSRIEDAQFEVIPHDDG
jgi:hypothetical protein